MLKDYFFFAWKNLSHKKIRGWLTLLGIFIGVTAVVSLISLGDGLKTAVSSQFGISTTEVITVQAGGITGAGPPGTGVPIPLTQDDVDAIRKLGSVDIAIPRNIIQGKIEFNDRAIFGFAANMPNGEERDFAENALSMESEFGRLLRDGDSRKVFLGYNFGADKVGLEKAVKVGDSVIVQDVKFEVAGISEKEGSFIFDNIVWMNSDDLKDITPEEDKDNVNVIVVKVKNKDLIQDAKEDIEKLLRKRRDVKLGEEDFEVSTPESSLSTVNSVLTGIQVFVAMVASISIFIGAIGIVNTMTTAVMERKKQIGVMKAIGAKNSDIFFQFFIESGILGLVGGIIGVIFGKLIGYYGTIGISNFIGSSITPELDIWLIIFTLIGSFLVGALSGVVPALQAANQDPVEAMRG